MVMEPTLHFPSKFDDYKYKSFYQLVHLFEKGLTPTGALLLPMCKWDHDMRKGWLGDRGSSASWTALLKIYIYTHVQWDEIEDKKTLVKKVAARDFVKPDVVMSLYEKYKTNGEGDDEMVTIDHFTFALFCMQTRTLSENC